MCNKHSITVCIAGLWLLATKLQAQDPNSIFEKGKAYPSKLINTANKRVANLTYNLNRKTRHYLNKVQKQENLLRQKFRLVDTSSEGALFNYQEDFKTYTLSNATVPPGIINSYSGRLDSLQTAVKFLAINSSVSSLNKKQLEQTLTTLEDFQQKLQQASHLKELLQQRSNLLQQHFERLGMARALKRFKKHVYYYQAQVDHYKQLFENPQNIELKLIELVSTMPQFQEFFADHAQLGQLFSLPTSAGVNHVSLQGLQTKSSIRSLLDERFGTDMNSDQLLSTYTGRNHVANVKNVIEEKGKGSFGYGNDSQKSNTDFKPNQQKTKSFFRRLEVGASFQSQRAKNHFPASSNIGLQLGYKLNDKGMVGLGAMYKIGWGYGWNHLRLSHQGVLLRSFIEWQVKGSFFIAGGYERAHNAALKNTSVLSKHKPWQSSGLLGASRKYKVGKLRGNMQLLWDFLSSQQVPQTQPIVWRVGYTIK